MKLILTRLSVTGFLDTAVVKQCVANPHTSESFVLSWTVIASDGSREPEG